MSSIFVDFEVLPEDGPSQISASQVCSDLKRQLADPGSALRLGEFRNFAARATLADAGDAIGGGGMTGTSGPASSPFSMEEPMDAARDSVPPVPTRSGPGGGSDFARDNGRFQGHGGGTWGAQGAGLYDGAPPPSSGDVPRYGGDWQHGGSKGMSNAELVDRISHLERELSHTAAGGHGAQERTPMPRRSIEVEALEERCQHLQHRLEAIEPELREAHESARSYRTKAEQAELRLKDREQLLAHAKEMWMKENVRASRLADALTAAEDQLADQERRLRETIERHDRAQQEVRQLQHLLGDPANGISGFSGGGFNGGFSDPYGGLKGNSANGFPKLPATTGSLPQQPYQFDNMGDLVPGRPSTARNLTAAQATIAHQYLDQPPGEAETNAERFRRLCHLSDAVLFEDELLQVGVKMEFSGRDGQVQVYFGNKGNAALQAFTVQYFVREDNALQLTATPISQQLDADAQVVQRINVHLLQPFVEPPWLRIQFLLPDASPRRIQTRFPIVLTKFMMGRELSSSEFFRLWRHQHFVLNEATSIVHLAARLDGPLMHVARCVVFGGALRLHHGVDTNPDNIVLVCEVARGAGDGIDRRVNGQQLDRNRDRDFGYGEGQEHGLDEVDMHTSLIRVEIGKDRFAGKARVVVRSGSHAISRALCDGIVAQLAEAGATPSSGGLAAMAR